MNDELYEWEVWVGDVCIGRASTEDRWNLFVPAIEKGLIPEDYKMVDVQLKLVKKDNT